jgi:hypothetical protein
MANSKMPTRYLNPRVAERIDAARVSLFRAQSIVSVAAAASMSETPADRFATESSLRYVAEILSDVADMLDPIELGLT